MASGVAAGIASNAQPYTLAELDAALRAVGLGSDVFRADLSFWSFQNGFSKPDPHVFQALSARLRAAGALPEEVLMVGDRMDNDITPARRCGWQAFHLRAGDGAASSAGPGGDWHDLARWLDGKL
jgi:HAD superfamily hydrolase (TIGR01549 family)